MKKLAALGLAVLLCLASLIPGTAEEITKEGISASFSDVFYVFTDDSVDSMQTELAEIGETAQSMRTRLSESGYLFYAVSPALKSTVFLSCTQNDVSRSIGDLINYSDQDAAKKLLIGSSLDTAYEVRELEKDGALFYRVVCTADLDPGLSDSRVFYITVMNGSAYTLCLIEKASSLSGNAVSAFDSIFASLRYTVESQARRVQEHKDKVTRTLFYIMIPIAVLIVGYLGWSLAGDFRMKRLEEDRKRNIRKRPRR